MKMVLPYPDWMKETALEKYLQGLNTNEIATLTGISQTTVWKWCREAGISRSRSEASRGKKLSLETRKKMSEARKGFRHSPETRLKIGRKGELSSNYKGDEAGYNAQHIRAEKDYPLPLGICELCGKKRATVRMRMDHTLLPYLPELVAIGCHSCNMKHDSGTISITFLSPYDSKWYCAIRENGKARLLEVS
jgi:transposase-like protein